MTDDDHRHRSPLDHALDVFVYAPLGFVAEAPSLLPRFARRGRQQAELAQALTRFALHRDADELDVALRQHPDVRSRLAALGLLPPSPRPAADADPAATDGGPTGAGRPHLESVPAPPAPDVRANGSGIDPESLAILDYESLSASQVVPRLDGLTADELEAVRRYESGNRARRTILSKIAQLQGS